MHHLGLVSRVEPDKHHALFTGVGVHLFPKAVRADVPVEHIDLGIGVAFLDFQRVLDRYGAADTAAVEHGRIPIGRRLVPWPDALDHDHLLEVRQLRCFLLQARFQFALRHDPSICPQSVGRTRVFLGAGSHHDHAVLDQLLAESLRFLHRGLEVAHVAFVSYHHAVGQHLDALVGLHTIDHIRQKSAHISAQGIDKDAACPTTQFRVALHQVHPIALIGQVEGRRHTRHSAANHQCTVVKGLGLGMQRKEQARPCHSHPNQVLGLCSRPCRLPAVHPASLVANVGHFKEVGIEPRPPDRLAKDRLVRTGRTRGDNDAVQVVFLDLVLDQLERVGRARVRRVICIDDIVQAGRIRRHVCHVDHPRDIAAAAADKTPDARLIRKRYFFFRRIHHRLDQCTTRLAKHRQRGRRGATCLDDAVRDVLWFSECAADKHARARGLDRMEWLAQRKTVLVQANADRLCQRLHILRRLHAHREHEQIKAHFLQRAIPVLIAGNDLSCLRILVHDRQTAVVIDNTVVLPASIVRVKALAKGTHIHLEHVYLDAGHVFHDQHRLFGRVHAADRRAVRVLLIPRPNTLQKGNALGLRAIRHPCNMSSRGAGCAEHSFEFKRVDHVGKATIAPFRRPGRIIETVARSQDHSADL